MNRREKIAAWVLGVLLFAGLFFIIYNAFLSQYGPGEEEFAESLAFPGDLEGTAPPPELEEEEEAPETTAPETEPEPEETEAPPPLRK